MDEAQQPSLGQKPAAKKKKTAKGKVTVVTARAPLSMAKLAGQYSVFFCHATLVARSMQQPKKRLAEDAVLEAGGEEEVVSLPSRTTLFLRELSRSPGTADAISEWIKLGQLILVQVHGSCEDERVFSAMAYLKDKQRNRQGEAHLNVTARLFHQPWFTLATFPVDDALEIWHASAGRRGRDRAE